MFGNETSYNSFYFFSKFESCILQMPLLQSTPYQLYKLQPFRVEQQEKVFVYFEITKEFIFKDAMKHNTER